MKFSPKILFLLLTIIGAAIYVYPDIQYQELLSQGDHGRDLYAFEEVLKGKLPYKDFWWVYGPLMPYYYGLFYKIFGFHITSVLLGRAVLVVMGAAFLYLSAETIMTPALAFLAALWFTQSRLEFFFTYNHLGGIVAELIAAYGLFAYLRQGATRFLWTALIAIFSLMMIKINFGLAGLVGLVLSVALIDYVKKYPWNASKTKLLLTAGILVPLLAGLIYAVLFKGLSLTVIRQCMPYFGDDQPYHASIWKVIPYYFQQHWLTFRHGLFNMSIGIILHTCTLFAVFVLITRRINPEELKNLILYLMITGLFFILYFHEFLVSGVWYRNFWSFPFLILFHFTMISIALPRMPQILRIIILFFLWALTTVGIVAHIGSIQSQKVPARYLSVERGKVFLGNEPQWTDTVNNVTEFLNKTLKKDELFFALPYDCIYYYLTGKESPTRQLIFFDHIKITREQEISIIKELDSRNVNYVLMSNRIASPETGLGVFGKTYCPLIARYIEDNFRPIIRQGGDWQQPPGWGNNHGVLIFKRK